MMLCATSNTACWVDVDVAHSKINYVDQLCGCGALQTLDAQHGEVKTMRTRTKFLRKGVGQAVLSHIVNHATDTGIKRLSLETGSSDVFLAARAMYLNNGFGICGPFGDYKLDPYSVFMTKLL